MLKRIVQLFFIIVGGTLGYLYIPDLILILNNLINLGELPGFITSPYIGIIIGAGLFYVSTFWLADYIVGFIQWMEESLMKAPVADVLFGSFGLIFGLFVAYLAMFALNSMELSILVNVIGFFCTALLGYIGFRFGFKKREELVNVFTSARFANKKKEAEAEAESKSGSGTVLKILDTSVIIDGRIADVCQTGFLEGPIVIPQFVLEELQHIADSSDVLKRNRGRRGLDILNRIQKDLAVKVEIYEGDFEDIHEVDSKLVKLGKLVSGMVVTNDYNLNKVCEFQGVPVLNINDLANAVKPVVLPGEELNVQVIKDGKEQNQGVGYLDDGTMIVVEDGRDYIGKTIEVLVTSVLQTSAGRMIFAKPKLLEKAL
ncbi:PIN/TRAM domain-containing protein [Pseudalkalibacillus sp. SCS-8]|uniref:PIN/TRAM domain-containing protein n=1 Tax=Pseudalkalibacillus nanhaiensis TaxID=3115291 RepID=UPI0032DA3077